MSVVVGSSVTYSRIELCCNTGQFNHVLNAALLIGYVFGISAARYRDEMCRPFKDTYPQRWIEDGVINVADEVAAAFEIIAVSAGWTNQRTGCCCTGSILQTSWR